MSTTSPIPALPAPLGPFDRVRAVAARLKLSPATVYRLVECGTLPSVRIGNAIRIPRAELDRFLAGQLRGQDR